MATGDYFMALHNYLDELESSYNSETTYFQMRTSNYGHLLQSIEDTIELIQPYYESGESLPFDVLDEVMLILINRYKEQEQ